jgi:uncharacterized membrane protein
MDRSHSLDLIKGIAVLIMIFANTSVYFFNFIDFNFIRLICSFAAPVFLILTGYFTQMNLLKYDVNKNILILRALQILCLGAFIDIVFWGTIPFITYDILYLIAFSQLILIFINFKYYIFLVLLILLGSFIIPNLISYRFEIDEISVQLFDSFKTIINSKPLKRLFYDGWFPILPWLAFVLMGALMFRNKIFFTKYSTYFLMIGLSLFGLTYLIIVNQDYPIRNFYLEIWYPLKNTLLLIPFSVFFIIIGLIDNRFYRPKPMFNFFIILGKNSLFAYIFNSFLMALAIFFGLNQSNYPLYFILFFISIVVLGVFIMNRFRKSKKWVFTPSFVKFFLGYN